MPNFYKQFIAMIFLLLVTACASNLRIESTEDAIGHTAGELQAAYDTIGFLKVSEIITAEKRDELVLEAKKIEDGLVEARRLLQLGDIDTSGDTLNTAKSGLVALIAVLEALE